MDPDVTYNYFYRFVTNFVETWAEIHKNVLADPVEVAKASQALTTFLSSSSVLAKLEFDPTAHFKFRVVPKSTTMSDLVVCMDPQTSKANEILFALKIPVDQSVIDDIYKKIKDPK